MEAPVLDADAITWMTDTVADAQATPHTIPKLTDTYPTMSIDDGYAVQDALLARWREAGRVLVGLKAALTSQANLDHMGHAEPPFGMLMGDQIAHDGCTVPPSH